MYATLWTKPNDEGAVVQRLIDDAGADGPMTIQPSDNSQQIIVELVCATHEEYVRTKRYLQDLPQCAPVQDGVQTQHHGLLFTGTLSTIQYLPIGTRADGEYVVNFTV
jgi:hypothetical protein